MLRGHLYRLHALTLRRPLRMMNFLKSDLH